MRRYLLGLFLGVGLLVVSVSAPISISKTSPTVLATSSAHAQDACGGDTGKACTLAQKIADSSEGAFVFPAWKVVRSIINILLIIALLVISFSNITRVSIDTYTVKKALPNLLIGIVLANASLFIIRYLADISSVAVHFFVEQAGMVTFKEFISTSIAMVSLTGVLKLIGSTGGLFAVSGAVPLIFLLIMIVALIGIVWLAVILYLRLAVIYLLTILSPLAFVAYGIPGFEKYFKQWWQQFTKWLFILPAMAAIFWIMLVIGRAGEFTLIRYIIVLFLFYQALLLPTKWGGSIASKVSDGFQKYTGLNAARKWAGDSAKLAGNAVVANTAIGRWQEKSKLWRENADKSIANARQRRAIEARTGKLGRNAARLDLEGQVVGGQEEKLKSDNLKYAFDADEGLRNRLKITELEKNASEKRLEEAKKLHALDFLKKAQTSDDDINSMTAGNEKEFVKQIKRVLQEFSDATADEEIISGEVGREEGIIKGNTMNRLFQIPQLLTNYKDYKEHYKFLKDKYNSIADKTSQEAIDTKNEMDNTIIQIKSVRKSYDTLKNKEGYKNIGDLDISNTDIKKAAQLVGLEDVNGKKDFADANPVATRIAQGQQRQALKAFNAGVMGQIKDEIKEQTIPQIQRELSDYLNKDLKKLADKTGVSHAELKKAFFDGDTAKLSALGMEDYKVRNGLVIAEKFKTVQKSVNDIRHSDALNTWMAEVNNTYKENGQSDFFSPDDIKNASGTNNDRKKVAAKVTSYGVQAQSPAIRQQKGPDYYSTPQGPNQAGGQANQPNTTNSGTPNYTQEDLDYADDHLSGGYGDRPNVGGQASNNATQAQNQSDEDSEDDDDNGQAEEEEQEGDNN